VNEVLSSPGQPLDTATREFMEPRFGYDFSQVRVHDDQRASASAQEVNALAYTVGSNIIFRSGYYKAQTKNGRRLVAHELVHVIQQGSRHTSAVRRQDAATSTAPNGIGAGSANALQQSQVNHRISLGGAAHYVLQRWPGDGIRAPGECAWAKYLTLRGAVEAAKAVVDGLGSCTPTDLCPLLAIKIGAIATEIAARVALDTSCFKGGNTGHRQQVKEKISMLNTCYRFFTQQNCPELLATAAAAVATVAAVAAEAAEIAEAVSGLIAALGEALEAATLVEVLEGLLLVLAL
jgi:Domain of unknown function (DUF4157)/Novel toxin 16